MSDIFDEMRAAADATRVLFLQDADTGLRAMIALDDTTLGPACGGIRTRAYPDVGAALLDVQRLASAMTLKCAIAGLPAGGGKSVVLAHPGLDRPAAFRKLGQHIEALGGLYRAAGDLGTTYQDLLHVAETTGYVDTSGERLGAATGEGVVNCIRAVARDCGRELLGLTVAVQGCGLIGAGVARLLAAEGARLVVADLDPELASSVAADVGGRHVPASEVLAAECDVVAPCAVGGVLTDEAVARMRAWAVCGGANNQLGNARVLDHLTRRNIAYVPDFLASAGAVIDGIARALGDGDPVPLIAALEHTAATVLARSRAEGVTTVEVGVAIARARIDARARSGSSAVRST